MLMVQLNPGDKAPLFSALDQDGNMVSLDSYKGSRVVLYFYPRDNTAGCTAEAQNLRDGKGELGKAGFKVLGVSPDSVKSHFNFHTKQSLNFPIISDPDKAIADAYGVWGEKKFMGRTGMGIHRTTFVIDADGVIEKVFRKVDTKNHWQQILDSCK